MTGSYLWNIIYASAFLDYLFRSEPKIHYKLRSLDNQLSDNEWKNEENMMGPGSLIALRQTVSRC